MKALYLGIAVNSGFIHILLHLRMALHKKEAWTKAMRGIGREFTRFYII